ncbi:peptide deformylase [Acinetobacter populi]|uniref:Peptide deformylase n=1 Tax=Acinetobacter populi TaxID=1582270 RepID=A0A1Z9Z089_9GAMM|nr:peptide deformylase [Acinetobacter populi]OUY07875.1 peptide deformylase [Acinetobacter populi]
MHVILPVAQRGEQILTLQAAPVAQVELNSQWLKQLASAMLDTMLERNGVGIAAPQVYVSKRVIIVASRPNPRYPEAPEMAAIVMINPEIIEHSTETCLGEEGCLSVADLRRQVERAQAVTVRYLTLEGEVIQRKFEGFPARIVQHEVDHLNGILFVERTTTLQDQSIPIDPSKFALNHQR